MSISAFRHREDSILEMVNRSTSRLPGKPSDRYRHRFDAMTYKPNDVDYTRLANKLRNESTNVIYRGSMHAANDDTIDMMIDLQKRMTYNQLVADQITNRKKSKMEAVERERQKDLEDDIRIKRENEMLEKRKEEEDRRIAERLKRQTVTDGFYGQLQRSGANTKKITPIVIKEAIQREIDIGLSRMTFDKETARIEVTRKLTECKPQLLSYADLAEQKISAIVDLHLAKMLTETSLANRELDKHMHQLRQSNRGLVLAKTRLEHEKLKLINEMHSIKNNEQLKIVELYKKNRNTVRADVPLRSEVYYSKPEILKNEDMENVFPMDLYNDERGVRGEVKIWEDAFVAEDGEQAVNDNLMLNVASTVKHYESDYLKSTTMFI